MSIFNFGSHCHWKVFLHSTQNIYSMIPHLKRLVTGQCVLYGLDFWKRVSISLNLSVQGHFKIRLNSTDCSTPLQDTTTLPQSINYRVPHLPAVEAKIRGAITKFGQPRVKFTCTLANVLYLNRSISIRYLTTVTALQFTQPGHMSGPSAYANLFVDCFGALRSIHSTLFDSPWLRHVCALVGIFYSVEICKDTGTSSKVKFSMFFVWFLIFAM